MPFNSIDNTLMSKNYGTVNKNIADVSAENYTKLVYPTIIQKYHQANGGDFIQPNTSGHVPHYNMDEMRRINGLHSEVQTEVLEGEGIGRLFNKAVDKIKEAAHKTDKATKPAQKEVKKAAEKIAKSVKKEVTAKATKAVVKDVIEQLKEDNELLEGEGIGKAFKRAGKKLNKAGKQIEKTANKAANAVKKVATKAGDAIKESAINKDGLIHNIIESTADVVLPEVGAAIGTAIGTAAGNPALGAYAGKKTGEIARKTLKKQTGYGSSVGKYEGGAHALDAKISKYATATAKELDKQMNNAAALGAKAGKGSRNEIVKKIMAEKNLSMIQASKYVKENGLY